MEREMKAERVRSDRTAYSSTSSRSQVGMLIEVVSVDFGRSEKVIGSDSFPCQWRGNPAPSGLFPGLGCVELPPRFASCDRGTLRE